MVELKNERIDQILHEETAKKEELTMILRSIYTRYMRLYEEYLSDIGALNDDKIEAFRKYNEETESLIKHYYMDIPHDVCVDLNDFEEEYGANLLGPKWHDYVSEAYKEFSEDNDDKNESEIKEAFKEHVLKNFYESMDYVFRESFGTESKNAEGVQSMIKGLLFEKDD